MRIAVVGSRNYTNLNLVADWVRNFDRGTVVVSGGASGVDTVAEQIAREEPHLDLLLFYPDYSRYGPKAAPLMRNGEIARECDVMNAFWDGRSNGTMDAVRQCNLLGKPVMLVAPKSILFFNKGKEVYRIDTQTMQE